MREVLFIRHGQTDWNAAGRMQGQIQAVPLNETGLRQAHAAAAFLENKAFDLIVSSTLDRAAVTAQIIAERAQKPVVYDKRLIERKWGVAEGLRYADFDDQDPRTFFTPDGRMDWIMPNKRQPKDSETREALADRATEAFFDTMAKYPDKRLLFVSHGAWLRALAERLIGIDITFPNAVPYSARDIDGRWTFSPLDG